MNTCKDCAKSYGIASSDGQAPMGCERHQGYLARVWPDACCPAFEKRRDKLDERADEVINALKRTYVRSWVGACDSDYRRDIRALLARWAAEDKEAR